MNTITPLKAWLKAATTVEQEALAARVGTSLQMLRFYANGNRVASSERAGEIEEATTTMAKASKGRLPVVLRTDLAPACRACQYARRCLGDRALASEFPIISG